MPDSTGENLVRNEISTADWRMTDINVGGGIVKTISLREEWDRDIRDPEQFLSWISLAGIDADIVTFLQRLPRSRPDFQYYYEWDNTAAIPVSTHEEWRDRQITQEARNKIRKAYKTGLKVLECEPDDRFLDQVVNIYKETPVRQNRPFKDFFADESSLRKGLTTFPERARYFGAFLDDQLVAYMKLVPSGIFARTMGILASVRSRSSSPMNALVDTGVAFCAEREIRYLVYGKFSYGKKGSDSLQEFKVANGFEHILLPRYYVPISLKGRQALRLKLHKGVMERLPRKVVRKLLKVRDDRWRKKAKRWEPR